LVSFLSPRILTEASIYNGYHDCPEVTVDTDVDTDVDVALGYCECATALQTTCAVESAAVQCATTVLEKGGG
jgi:hypothetical protein